MPANWGLKVVEITSGRPYTDDEDNIRTFDPYADDAEYVWHRDMEDREIEVLDGEGWCFQVDKCLPWLLKKGMIFNVKKFEYHRLIKGITPLKCRVIKHVIGTTTKS